MPRTSRLKFTAITSFFALACLVGSKTQADTLAQIYELALKNDPVLRAAEATYKAGAEASKQGLAGLLPQVSASGEFQDADNEDTGLETTRDTGTGNLIQFQTASDADSDTTTYSINVHQNIFNLPAWFAYKQGKQLSKRAEATFGADQQQLIIRVTSAYLDVLRQGDNLSSSRAEEAAIKRQLEQTQQRYDVGLIAITDVHEAAAAYDLAVVTRLSDENNLGNAYEALLELTGQEHSNLWRIKSDFAIANPSPNERDAWVDLALENNYSLRAAHYSVEAARQNSRAMKSEHLPKVTGSYAYIDEERDGDVTSVTPITGGELRSDLLIDNETETSVFGLRVELPLFTGGLTSSKRRQAAYEYTANHENYISTKRRTIQTTRSIFLTTSTDVARVRARQLSITSAQSALDATEAGYDAGTRNIVDVLNAQRDLFRAQRDYANSRYDYVINMLRLKEAAGTLNPQDIYDLNAALEAPAAVLKSASLDYTPARYR